MRRRAFIAAALAALAAAAGWLVLGRDRAGLRRTERDLREHFSYLRFDDELLHAFTRDLARLDQRLARDEVRRRFLLSTDFFANGEDETRPLAYRAFCDPYLSPCYSPFA